MDCLLGSSENRQEEMNTGMKEQSRVTVRYRNFTDHIVDEESAIDALGFYQHGYPPKCRECEKSDPQYKVRSFLSRKPKSEIFVCESCGYQYDVRESFETLRGTRKPIITWFRAWYYMDVEKLSYRKFANKVGITLGMARKIEQSMVTSHELYFREVIDTYLALKRKGALKISLSEGLEDGNVQGYYIYK